MALTVHPAVKSSVNTSIITTLAVAFVNAATPDMLAGLGKYEPAVVGALVIASTLLGAVTKKGAPSTESDAPAAILDPATVQKLIDTVAVKLEQPAPEAKTVPVTVTPQPGA